MEVRIPSFTLCKEFQETILSLQVECTRMTAESSALPDDSVHHSTSEDVPIISDPIIPKFPPCLVVEERPPSPCLVFEEHPPSPKSNKRKSLVFVSTLRRKKTRSARSTKASVGWKNMEQAIPILHPFSFVDKEVVVTQEPVPSNKMTMTQETASSQNLVVTQEPATQEEIVPQEPVMPELVVTQEPTSQKEIVPQEPVMPKLVVTQEPVIMSVSATKESVTQHSEDVPLSQLFAQIEKKIKDTENSRISELMKENESFKAELASLEKELQVSR
jgi:hypothetical protein